MANDHTSEDRRRALLRAHYAAENANDLDRIMGTFSTVDGSTMIYNHQPFTDPDGIRAAHAYIGFSAAGALWRRRVLSLSGQSPRIAGRN